MESSRELEVMEVQSEIQKGKVAFARGEDLSANLKLEVSNMSSSGTPSRKKKDKMISPVSIQDRGKLEAKEVKSKGKVAFAKGAISSANFKDTIGKKTPSGILSEKREAQKLSAVATQEEDGSDSGEHTDYSDEGDWPEGSCTYANKDYDNWDVGDFLKALPRRDNSPEFYTMFSKKMVDWEF